MSLKHKIKAGGGKLLRLIETWNAVHVENKKINEKRRKPIIDSYPLTKEQKKEIDEYYLKYYGKKVPYKWHQEYAAFTKKFDVTYLPEILFIPKINPALNNRVQSVTFEDKTLLPLVINNLDYVRTPKIIASQTEKFNLRYGNEFIKFEDLISKLSDIGLCFIKPARDTCSGFGCQVLDIHNGINLKTNERLEDILKQYRGNFLIEEIVTNAKEIKALHPQSLNTFRIMTYVVNNEVKVCAPCMRIGMGENNVDNAHAGGIFIGVDLVGEDGVLKDTAYTEFNTQYKIHPDSKVEFNGYVIPHFKRVIDSAIRLHKEKYFNMGLIGYDIVLDENYMPTVIEVNLNAPSPWLHQMVSGKGLFSEDTKYMLDMIRK